jgi:fucose 4-O-acetylase-like acetyltransferase
LTIRLNQNLNKKELLQMTNEKERINIKRIYFLDNLRTFMIFLVIVVHASLIYEKSGFSAAWWIIYDPSESDFPGLLFFVLDIFVMATIFFISGYLTPLSLKNKNNWVFIKSKFKRLMIPWILAVLTLIPLYKTIFLYSRNLPQHDWTTYFHWSNGIWSQNWLWFLPVLFLFNILYLLIDKIKLNKTDFNLKTAVTLVFLTAVLNSVFFDTLSLHGWTKTIFIDFQNERLLIYFIIFLLGSHCYRLKLFETRASGKKLYILLNSTVWLPTILYLVFLFYPLINPGKYIFSKNIDILLKWLNFHLSLLSMIYILINTFRYYLNKQGNTAKSLNKNSYNVYIIHTIIMGALALILLNTEIYPMLKYFVLITATFIISNLLVSFYRSAIKSKIFINRKEATMKALSTGLLFIILFAVVSCGSQDKSAESQETVAAPKVDLHSAVFTGDLETIRQHVQAGSDLNVLEPSRASTPLITAAFIGNADAAKILIDAGAALNYQNADGSTALHTAAVFGKTDIAKMLIAAGTDLNTQNNNGATALHTAAFFCHKEIVKELLAKGADKSIKNKSGQTAYDTVAGTFEEVIPIYDAVGAGLKPLGLKLDYEHLKTTRPQIAEMLK